MGFGNGYSVGHLFHKEKESVRLKYFIPLFFLLSIIAGFIILLFSQIKLLKIGFIAEILLYFACATFFAVKAKSGFINTIIIVFLFLIFHISYGAGVLLGVLKKHRQ